MTQRRPSGQLWPCWTTARIGHALFTVNSSQPSRCRARSSKANRKDGRKRKENTTQTAPSMDLPDWRCAKMSEDVVPRHMVRLTWCPACRKRRPVTWCRVTWCPFTSCPFTWCPVTWCASRGAPQAPCKRRPVTWCLFTWCPFTWNDKKERRRDAPDRGAPHVVPRKRLASGAPSRGASSRGAPPR